MGDHRTINKDVDTATLFDRVESDRTDTVNSIIDLLRGTTNEYDNIEQILDDFTFHVRFETIYLYENGPWVPTIEDQSIIARSRKLPIIERR